MFSSGSGGGVVSQPVVSGGGAGGGVTGRALAGGAGGVVTSQPVVSGGTGGGVVIGQPVLSGGGGSDVVVEGSDDLDGGQVLEILLAGEPGSLATLLVGTEENRPAGILAHGAFSGSGIMSFRIVVPSELANDSRPLFLFLLRQQGSVPASEGIDVIAVESGPSLVARKGNLTVVWTADHITIIVGDKAVTVHRGETLDDTVGDLQVDVSKDGDVLTDLVFYQTPYYGPAFK